MVGEKWWWISTVESIKNHHRDQHIQAFKTLKPFWASKSSKPDICTQWDWWNFKHPRYQEFPGSQGRARFGVSEWRFAFVGFWCECVYIIGGCWKWWAAGLQKFRCFFATCLRCARYFWLDVVELTGKPEGVLHYHTTLMYSGRS